MRSFVNNRSASLAPSGIRKFFDLVHEKKNAISLGVGEPDFITPWDVRDFAVRSIQKGRTQYTGNRGLIQLREKISRYLFERFSLDYSPERIIVTVGASEAIDIALRAVCEFGDEVLIPDPSYVSYAPCVSLCGGKPVGVKCSAENGFILTPEAIESAVSERTKAIILAYPNNPTGAIMTEKQLKDIIPVIEKYDLLVISDEIYSELTYGGRHCSIASIGNMRERTVYINGFSKAFAMTGWRIGFMCAPPEIDEAAFKIHQYTIMCAPTVSQFAADYALSSGFEDSFSAVEEMRSEYDRRRRFIVKGFNDIGLSCFEPKGAFYVFPTVKSSGLDGEEFAERLLESEEVALVPGSAFGDCGAFHVRASYAVSMDNISAAIERTDKFLKGLR